MQLPGEVEVAHAYPDEPAGGQVVPHGISADIVTMRGAVELAPRLNIARFICDLVSTGATLEANGLAPVADVFDSEAVLVRTLKPIDGPHAEKVGALLTRIDWCPGVWPKLGCSVTEPSPNRSCSPSSSFTS